MKLPHFPCLILASAVLSLAGCSRDVAENPVSQNLAQQSQAAHHDEAHSPFGQKMRALEAKGDYANMEKAALEQRRNHPDDPGVFFVLGNAQFYSGQFAKARDNWTQGLEKVPSKAGEYQESLGLATRFAKEFPNEKWEPVQMVENEIALINRQNRELGARLLREKKYDEIEATLTRETQKPTVYADGSWKLADIYVGIFQGVDAELNEAAWQKRLDAITQWNRARPNSVYAPICLARSWVEGAWTARGENFADEVPQSAWQIVGERLGKAAPLFQKLNSQNAPHLLFYVAAQRFWQLEDSSSPIARQLEARAIARFPKYTNFYGQQATMLLPRWGGAPGEWESVLAKNADALAAKFGAPEGDKMYARVVWLLWDYHENMIKQTRIDYARAQRGFAQILKEHPDSIGASNLAFRLAWQKYDGKTMRDLMKNHIRGRADRNLWKDPAQFSGARIGMLRF